MKILEVTNLFAPVHGGAAEAPYQLCKHLAKRGHDVTLYTSDFKLSQEYITPIPEVKVRAFKTWLNIANLHVTPGIIKVRKEIKHFDVIHVHNYRTFQNIVICYYAKKYGVPYVLQSHGGVLPIVQKQGLKRIYDTLVGYKILKSAGKVIAGNETEVGEYEKMGVDRSRIVVIPPLYNTEEFSHLPAPGQFRQKYNIKEKHIILFLGRIHQIKGMDFLVDAFHRLSQQREDIFLAIVGPDSGYKSILEKQITRLGLSGKVLFTGLLGGVDKLSALVDATMLVQTSIYERGPGSPFEAILCGTPIIITRDTGAGETVRKLDAGYLVEYGNIPVLADLMRKVIDAPVDIKNKTEAAKQYIIAKLSWQNGVEEFEKLYMSLRN
ncbi:MAG: glycosyltransferase [Dehalococcoidales bacterium]|nr:glycosyltransferase [Dehalococcoidales bacterium]